ncbi:MAG: UPF0175 family protein [Candidatus Micrarchaeota archaeon]
MSDMVSFRLGSELDQKLKELAKQENEEKSTLIRELLLKGIHEKQLENALELYKKGKVSLAKAARLSGVSLWKMLDILRERKVELNYSQVDLSEDLKSLKE